VPKLKLHFLIACFGKQFFFGLKTFGSYAERRRWKLEGEMTGIVSGASARPKRDEAIS
jgi:hypothetical protein